MSKPIVELKNIKHLLSPMDTMYLEGKTATTAELSTVNDGSRICKYIIEGGYEYKIDDCKYVKFIVAPVKLDQEANQ